MDNENRKLRARAMNFSNVELAQFYGVIKNYSPATELRNASDVVRFVADVGMKYLAKAGGLKGYTLDETLVDDYISRITKQPRQNDVVMMNDINVEEKKTDHSDAIAGALKKISGNSTPVEVDHDTGQTDHEIAQRNAEEERIKKLLSNKDKE